MAVIKWPGGKAKLAPAIREFMPDSIECYAEPFFGSGAMFFHLMRAKELPPGRCFLHDANKRLMRMWAEVFRYPHLIAEELKRLDIGASPESRASLYYSVRQRVNSPDYTGADVLWLARCAFNGLWRENRKGQMNVPHGTCNWNLDSVVDEIHKASALGNSFSCGLDKSRPIYPQIGSGGDASEELRMLVEILSNYGAPQYGRRLTAYLDPPYLYPDKRSFTDYSKGGFGLPNHQRLSRVGLWMGECGHHVICSGADNQLTRDVYQGWNIHEVSAAGSIAADGLARGTRKELIMVAPCDLDAKIFPQYLP